MTNTDQPIYSVIQWLVDHAVPFLVSNILCIHTCTTGLNACFWVIDSKFKGVHSDKCLEMLHFNNVWSWHNYNINGVTDSSQFNEQLMHHSAHSVSPLKISPLYALSIFHQKKKNWNQHGIKGYLCIIVLVIEHYFGWKLKKRKTRKKQASSGQLLLPSPGEQLEVRCLA